jgi:hypothetical protein
MYSKLAYKAISSGHKLKFSNVDKWKVFNADLENNDVNYVYE